jgi:hypothetical protein
MKRFVVVLVSIVVLSSFLTSWDKTVFTIELKNGGEFGMNEVYWGDKLERYSADIVAPVCEEGICYNVNVIFNWNLIGEFINYQTQPYNPLTKLDHKPFTLADYAKLQSILTNHDLVFTGMSADKLVTKTRDNNVDAYSGATVEAIKGEVIEGALFTCHTLWHVANGAVVDSIRNHTKSRLDKRLIEKIIGYNSASAHYYLINNLSEAQFAGNLTEVLALVKNGKGYLLKNTIEKIPEKLFDTQMLQGFLIKNYDSLSYYTQVAVLNKLQNSTIKPELSAALLTQISDRNSAQNQKIITLVIKNKDADATQKLLNYLIKQKIKISEMNYRLLEEMKVNQLRLLEKI